MNLIFVFVGGGIGSVARYITTTFIKNVTAVSFPFGTLTVNIIGSFFMGLITALIAEKFFSNAEPFRLALAVGFLGGFTTFSSFSMETLTLIERHEILYALTNVAANVAFGLLAAYFGFTLMKNIL